MQISKLTHCNVYLAGVSHVGKFSEVTVPEVKHKAQDHKSGDMIGTRRVSGPLEAMECTLKADGFYPDFHIQACDPDTELKLQVRCNLKTYSGGKAQDVPVSMDLVCWCSSNKVGTLQSQDYAKPEYKMEVSYFCLTVDGAEVQCIDVDNAVHRVNGEDLLAQFRTNLGLS
jgi:P2 family phage contractile tail tube protein